jgi:hypothetical protein
MSKKVIEFKPQEQVDSRTDSSEDDKGGKIFKFMSPEELAAERQKRKEKEEERRKIAWILKEAEKLDW